MGRRYEHLSFCGVLGLGRLLAEGADPAAGLPRFLALEGSPDRDVAWIARENRRKNRLARLL